MNNTYQGFTLIELSIVLVIIGLITGGVLVGRELIHAAEIRKTVRQIETLDASVNTFRNKYNCLPGDCKNATAFGLVDFQGNTGFNLENGDGNGAINDWGANGIYESLGALTQLAQNKFITITMLLDLDGIPYGQFSTALPTSDSNGIQGFWKIGHIGQSFDPSGHPNLAPAGYHYYWANAGAGYVGAGPGGGEGVFLPGDAFAIDSKLDDGLPIAGRVRSTSAIAGRVLDTNGAPPLSYMPSFLDGTDNGAPGASSNFCVTNGSPNQYNVQNRNHVAGNLCSTVVRASF